MSQPERATLAPASAPPLIEARQLVKEFPLDRRLFGRRRAVHAVNGVTFVIARGETFALVGESGCGKTTTGRMLLGLEPLTAGSIHYHGRLVQGLSATERAHFRRRVQVIFQDSNASLNPRKTLGQILSTTLRVSGAMPGASRAALRARVAALLDDVGLRPAASFVDRLPHELSGGQRQRVGIARALAPEPELVIADEPVSALDISVRAQILTLLAGIQRERGVAFLLISHDLAVVRNVAQRVGVMYLGSIIETGPVGAVFARPVHPYSAALLDATPLPDPRPAVRGRAHIELHGDVPSPIDLPSGCPFHPRCPIAVDRCRSERPSLQPLVDTPAVSVACHRAAERVAGLELPRTPNGYLEERT